MDIKHGWLYIADLNPRIGSELGKLRPVLVIQSDLLNQVGHQSTWVLPCTTRLVGENIIRIFLPRGMSKNESDCEIMIDQSRAIDNSRFKSILAPLPAAVFNQVKDRLRLLGQF